MLTALTAKPLLTRHLKKQPVAVPRFGWKEILLLHQLNRSTFSKTKNI